MSSQLRKGGSKRINLDTVARYLNLLTNFPLNCTVYRFAKLYYYCLDFKHVLISHFRWSAILDERTLQASLRGRKRMVVEKSWMKKEEIADKEEEVVKQASKKWRPMG